MLSRSWASSSTTRMRRTRCSSGSLQLRMALTSSSRSAGLQRKAHGAKRQRRLCVVVDRHHVDRNVSRVGIALQPIEQGQSGTVGKDDVQQNAVRRGSRASAMPSSVVVAIDAVEVELVREIEENPGERDVVLDDQNEAPGPAAGVRSSATGDRSDGRRRRHAAARRDWLGRAAEASGRRPWRLRASPGAPAAANRWQRSRVNVLPSPMR